MHGSFSKCYPHGGVTKGMVRWHEFFLHPRKPYVGFKKETLKHQETVHQSPSSQMHWNELRQKTREA